MTDSTFFALTDGARNIAIAGWPAENGWWAIAVDATGGSGISLGRPYRLFSSAVWREGETEIHECRKITKWKPRYRRRETGRPLDDPSSHSRALKIQ